MPCSVVWRWRCVRHDGQRPAGRHDRASGSVGSSGRHGARQISAFRQKGQRPGPLIALQLDHTVLHGAATSTGGTQLPGQYQQRVRCQRKPPHHGHTLAATALVLQRHAGPARRGNGHGSLPAPTRTHRTSAARADPATVGGIDEDTAGRSGRHARTIARWSPVPPCPHRITPSAPRAAASTLPPACLSTRHGSGAAWWSRRFGNRPARQANPRKGSKAMRRASTGGGCHRQESGHDRPGTV